MGGHEDLASEIIRDMLHELKAIKVSLMKAEAETDHVKKQIHNQITNIDEFCENITGGSM